MFRKLELLSSSSKRERTKALVLGPLIEVVSDMDIFNIEVLGAVNSRLEGHAIYRGRTKGTQNMTLGKI
jgi:hypothetical protein